MNNEFKDSGEEMGLEQQDESCWKTVPECYWSSEAEAMAPCKDIEMRSLMSWLEDLVDEGEVEENPSWSKALDRIRIMN